MFILMLLVIAFASAGLTHLWSFALGDPAYHARGEGVARGRILSRLGYALNQGFEQFEATTTAIRGSMERTATKERQLSRARAFDRPNPYKLLGVCPQCTNWWVAIIVFAIVRMLTGYSWWWLVLVEGLAYMACEIVQNIRHMRKG